MFPRLNFLESKTITDFCLELIDWAIQLMQWRKITKMPYIINFSNYRLNHSRIFAVE